MNLEPKFKPGDKVTFVNENGARFPDKTVVSSEVTTKWDGTSELRYHITPTDTPWYPAHGQYLEAQACPPSSPT